MAPLKRAIVLFILLSAFLNKSFSQDFSNFDRLLSSGKLPEDFFKLSKEKFKQDLADEKKLAKHHYVNQAKENFLLVSNYILDDLLQSGKVIFNDPVTAYVNKVADQVLANEPEKRKKLRFYCLRSNQVNAFSTNQGIIFVTIGLIAQLENEAQLAFVLSHEIVHYEKRHTIESYELESKVFSKNGQYRYNSYDDKIKAVSEFSKENEVEADSLGLIRFAKAGYDCNCSVTSMDVMQFSYLPFDEVKFDAGFLETQLCKLPKGSLLDSITPINYDTDNDDDSRASHPNIKKRRDYLSRMIDRMDENTKTKYIVGEKEFKTARKYARFELINIDLSKRNYVDVIYNCFLLKREEPQNRFLELSIAKSLYGISKYKLARSFSSISTSPYDVEGNIQQAHYVFDKLSDEQTTLLTLRYLYETEQKYPNENLSAYIIDLAKSLIKEKSLRLEDIQFVLSNYKKEKAKQEQEQEKQKLAAENSLKDTIKSPEPQEVSKYDKIREQKKKTEVKKIESETVENSKFHYMAFDDLFSSEKMKQYFEEASKQALYEFRMRDLSEKKYPTSKEQIELAEWNPKIASKKPMALGIDSVVVVDPFYFTADERKGVKLTDSEDGLLNFISQIKENSSLSGLNAKLLSPKEFTDADVEAYNDLALMNDWMGEKLAHDDVQMIPLHQNYVGRLVSRHHTKYFGYTGVITLKKKKENVGAVILYSILIYPALPIAIIWALTPLYSTEYYNVVYNIETGKPVMVKVTHIKGKSKNGYVNSVMYDQMKQIKKVKKVKM
jgi:beta-barrel assembly-enhancing protease